MDLTRKEVITKSNKNIAAEDIVRDHCYFEMNTKSVLFYHLSDHNYFDTNSQKQRKPAKKSQNRYRTIKITELKAIYNCKSCGYRTMDRVLSSKHNCDTNPAKYIIPCTKFDKNRTPVDRELLSKRNCDKDPAKYIPCTKCDKNKTPAGYQQCTKCTYFTKNKASLKIHMRIHDNGTPYKCTECEYSAKDLKDLISHYDKVKDLKCECGFATHVKQQMAAHRRLHSGEKPFSCGICNFSVADRGVLFRHMKKHEVYQINMV